MHDAHPLPGGDAVVEGVRIHVVRHGRDDRDHEHPPLVMLHGLPTSSYLWHDVMRNLEHGHRMAAPDLVGLGRSEHPANPRLHALDVQARLLLRVLDQLRLRRFVVVGHDIGGTVAVHMAAQAPTRVAGLVLCHAPLHADVWPVRPVLPLTLPGVRRAYAVALRRLPGAARQVMRRSLRTDLEPRELAHYVAPLLTAEGMRGLLDTVAAVDMTAANRSWQAVCAAAPPTLVLWGEDNHLLSPAYGRRLVADLPGAAWVPVSGGPLLPQERPERVAEEIDGFVADLPTRESSRSA